jgi:hypothetical protein
MLSGITLTSLDGNMRGLWLVLVCLLMVRPVSAREVLSGEEGEKPPLLSWGDLLPGLRQIGQKRYLLGGLLLGGFTAGITGALVANHRGYERYRAYLDGEDPLEITRLRTESERAFRSRNLFIIGTVAIGLIHLVDLTLWGKRSRISGEVYQNGLVFSFACSF